MFWKIKFDKNRIFITEADDVFEAYDNLKKAYPHAKNCKDIQISQTCPSNRDLIQKIEECNFECEAGPLVCSLDWLRLRDDYRRLQNIVDAIARAGIADAILSQRINNNE